MLFAILVSLGIGITAGIVNGLLARRAIRRSYQD
jgi:NhaP-type Na+/H+ or K+/H+ antiporter